MEKRPQRRHPVDAQAQVMGRRPVLQRHMNPANIGGDLIITLLHAM